MAETVAEDERAGRAQIGSCRIGKRLFGKSLWTKQTLGNQCRVPGFSCYAITQLAQPLFCLRLTSFKFNTSWLLET